MRYSFEEQRETRPLRSVSGKRLRRIDILDINDDRYCYFLAAFRVDIPFGVRS